MEQLTKLFGCIVTKSSQLCAYILKVTKVYIQAVDLLKLVLSGYQNSKEPAIHLIKALTHVLLKVD